MMINYAYSKTYDLWIGISMQIKDGDLNVLMGMW